MDKKQKPKRRDSKTSSRSKVFGASSLQIGGDDDGGVVSNSLIGSIVEKGISDNPPPPTAPPKLSVLPFPVARHRSHGPHWGPIGSVKNDKDSDNTEDDEEAKSLMNFEPIAPFANPVQRREKKGLDFNSWREIVPGDNLSMANKVEENLLCTQKTKKDRKMDVEPNIHACGHQYKSGEAMRSVSEDGCFSSVTDMELENLNQPNLKENVKDASPVDFKGEQEFVSKNNHISLERTEYDSIGFPEVLRRREQSTTVSNSRSNNFGNEQESMSLESQIDAENHARLQEMSPDEIAQAQAEIMEKMDPAIIKALKKRGQDKLKIQNGLSSEAGTNGEVSNPQNRNTQDAKGFAHSDSDFSSMLTTNTKDTQSRQDKGEVQKLVGTTSSRLWSAWSERVEAVRDLRFSLEGTVIENDFVQVPGSGDISVQNRHSVDNVSERDFLRTEGDPGASGYTIKEAVALTQSVIPGQRALALHLIFSVLDKALHNINQKPVGSTLGDANKLDRSTDWEAIWAFALGPEPELVLSLRISLDDNHNSVVLACAKVIQCILSCDVNENFFEISEKISTYEKEIFTAPVFRSKPEIDVGFLHGGFWKYSAKPSNIIPVEEDMVEDESEGKHTIQDDLVVAGQDFAAGLVRMGILPRLRYLLETDLTTALEECIISILVGIARHSPAGATAIMKCQRLVETVVRRFTMKDNIQIHPSKIISVTLLKVLARCNKKTCIEFLKKGTFRTMTWHLYQCVPSLDHWIKSGRENCKLSSALMVEQLRFWKVCIQYGYCISYFSDIFPALCLWLNRPTVEKLIQNNVLTEFASISKEAYLVLEALARRLPNLFSQERAGDNTEVWSWSCVGPMVDLAMKWMALNSDPHMSRLFEWQKGLGRYFITQDFSLTPLLWVYSAVMNMISRVLEGVIPEDRVNLDGGVVPWLPEFVPKVGLEIVKNGILSFSGANSSEHPAISFIEALCYLRQQSNYETSLASVCCLNGIVQVVVNIDKLIQLAKNNIHGSSQEYSISREGKTLEDGILKGSMVELRSLLNTFMKLVASEWHLVQSIEIFGRGGPAPGLGVGWGASGGGFWSAAVLLTQIDAGFLIYLLETFQFESSTDTPTVEEMTFSMQRINSALLVCLTAGPRDRLIVEKAINFLFHIPVLKFIDLCTRRFLHLDKRFKPFVWEYKEEDYLVFSETLASHFKNRWLSTKKKLKDVGHNSSGNKPFKKGSVGLDTIYEDVDTSNKNSQDCSSLVVEWAHQRLPLPMHWFLSPISTICDSKHAGLQKDKSQNLVQDPNSLFEVAKGGLFFNLGVEAISTFNSTVVPSPVQSVPLVWKFHSLSVILLVGMGVLEDEKSRDVYEALQDIYGQLLDQARTSISIDIILERNADLLPESRNKNNFEVLMFQSEIFESYSTFIETLVEQFSAISYGDLIFARQVAVYLHRHVEAPVRLAAWNMLSNARVLDLLPPLEKCIAQAKGYLEPVEDNAGILEAYLKSWNSGALDRAATRGSVANTLVLHHLSSYIFNSYTVDKLSLRNKLVKSLLRDYSQKPHHEGMMLNLIQYNKLTTSQMPDQNGSPLERSSMEKRFEVLTEACEGNSSLLTVVDKLKSSFKEIL
ncbi:transcriptional elongation regulator MINIYO isoform X2 [Quercus robur]|uniref:transcriptional elongation regulator MINIYO isoform X2 n=1 Tax=Quercus robur TaxID=38942 RepID=UPI002163FD7C|nr:transcriptional elongation regulator MINIYO isoform X2 [Quercus robur]